MRRRRNPQTLAAVLGATLAVPDGQPLVWALHALGHARRTRIYGPDLMALHCARAARVGHPIYLYGGRSPAALEAAGSAAARALPRACVIAGGYSPPFRALTAAEDEEVVAEIDGSGAAVVWVGTGQPKQELWMARMRPRLRAPLLVGVGAAFDFHAGLVSQAPGLDAAHGLEWSLPARRASRAGCGGATRATTPASSPASRASTRASAARRETRARR